MEVHEQKPNEVRRMAYAGKLYPADPLELSELVEQRIAASGRPQSAKGEVRAIVTPFAPARLVAGPGIGALRALNRHRYPTVVIVASAQEVMFDHASIFHGGAYETPLGRVFLDLELAKSLSELHPRVVMSARGHTGGRQAEFVIESMLPWLQKLIGNFRLIPIVAGIDDAELATGIGEVLAHPSLGNALIVSCTQVDIDLADSEQQARWQRVEAAFAGLDFAVLRDRLAHFAFPGSVAWLALTYAGRRRGWKRIVPMSLQGEEEVPSEACLSYVVMGN